MSLKRSSFFLSAWSISFLFFLVFVKICAAQFSGVILPESKKLYYKIKTIFYPILR